MFEEETFEMFEKKLKNEIQQNIEIVNEIENANFEEYCKVTGGKINNYANFKNKTTKNMEQMFLIKKKCLLSEQYANINKLKIRLEEEREFTKILDEQKKYVDEETERKWANYKARINKPYRGPLLGMAIREHGQPYMYCNIS